MLRIVPPTVPRVGRSDEHFPDGFELHLLPDDGDMEEEYNPLPILKAPYYGLTLKPLTQTPRVLRHDGRQCGERPTYQPTRSSRTQSI